MLRIFTVLAFLVLTTVSALAQSLTIEQEKRAKNLFSQLRCVVCQNQSIAESDADVAKDLREVVREQISKGNTNSQIKSFLVSRYGEYVLLKPNWGMHTMLLWLSPFLFLLLAFFWLMKGRSRGNKKMEQLSASEASRIDELLDK